MNSNDKEKKLLLTLITTAKMINFDVNGFYLLREVPLTCFFTFKLPKNIYFSQEDLFFRLISGFFMVF